MTYKETLEQEFQRLLKEPASQLGFEIYEQQSSNTGGALIKLQNPELRIQLVNDRGIINLDISPNDGPENFRDAELLYSLIRLNNSTVPLSKMGRKTIVNSIIGLKEQVTFLSTHYNELAELFSKASATRTLRQLEALGTERFNHMIG